MTLQEFVDDIDDKAWHRGFNACLDSVRASLVEYPNGGGDIKIMAEVERIARAAFLEGVNER